MCIEIFMVNPAADNSNVKQSLQLIRVKAVLTGKSPLTLCYNPLILAIMNKKILLLMILACTLIFGCSSGGSSKPVSIASGPVVTSISPASGGPGTFVTITGSNFGLVQSTSIVSYAGVTVIPVTWSNTQITLKVPDNAPNNGNFVVVVNGVYSNASMVFNLSNPAISYISPSNAAIGADVTISGQYFGTFNSGCYVTFNNTTAAVKNWNNTSITCTVPDFSSSMSGAISVVVWLDAYRYSNSYSFNLIVPTISTIYPSIDNVGARVTITGQGFGQTQGTVSIGGVGGVNAQIVSWSENSVQFRVPQVSQSGYQTLTLTAGGKQANSTFNVAAPAATTYSPTPIGKDQTLNISGEYFGNADDQVTRTLYIKDYGYVNNVNWSDNSLSFTWPVTNTWFGTKTVELTISVGGLTQTFTVQAN